MSILQEPPAPPLSVICDFFFEQVGPKGAATYDGDIYPYPPLPSDKGSDYRYAWGTTPIFLAVEFFGTAHVVKGKTEPHVIPPPGISVLEYFWDFGDGHTGHGPIVTHTYEVPDPNTAISLTVLDSLGREFSTSKALSLVIVDFGYIHQRIRAGVNKSVEGSGDFALSVEGTPTRIWIERGGKPVREETEKALSSDRASIQTRFYRHTTDKALSNDKVIRTRGLARHTTDTSLSSDVSKQNVRRFTTIEDESLSSDSTGSPIHQRPLRAKLGTLGHLPKDFSLIKKLKSTLTPLGKLPY